MRTIIALLTKDGTACSETMLVDDEDTPVARAHIEANRMIGADAPVPGTWTDCSENEYLQECLA